MLAYSISKRWVYLEYYIFKKWNFRYGMCQCGNYNYMYRTINFEFDITFCPLSLIEGKNINFFLSIDMYKFIKANSFFCETSHRASSLEALYVVPLSKTLYP